MDLHTVAPVIIIVESCLLCCLLFCTPGKVPGQLSILSYLFDGIELPRQCHFIIEVVNAFVAGATNKNTFIQLLAAVVLLKIAAPVYFTRYQVMESQCQFAITQAADIRALMPGIC